MPLPPTYKFRSIPALIGLYTKFGTDPTYKRRNVIERFFCRLKDFRRISTRYDKRADSFQAFLFLAASAVIFSILHI